MIDVHCHLNFKAFNQDCDEVIQRAFAAGVTKIINVGTKIDSSQKAVALAEQYENLYAIVGLHPHHADKPFFSHQERSEGSRYDANEIATSSFDKLRTPRNDRKENWLEQMEALAKHPKVVGIGECGMDYYRYKTNGIVDPKLQRAVFVKQIELAYKVKKPLQIHNRHAGEVILAILLDNKSYLIDPPGMFHCMSGNLHFLKKVLNMGFYVGFDGNITYEGLAPGEDTVLSDLVRATPLDRIVVESDSPYLTPIPFRGSRNEPKNAIIIGQSIADLKGVSYEHVVEQTTQNVKTLFKTIDD